MEDIFKQKLLSLRQVKVPATFAEALYPNSFWSPTIHKHSLTLKSLLPEEYSEKRQIINSLERFAHEKIEEAKSKIIQIPGGELEVRSGPTWEGLKQFNDEKNLRSILSLPSEYVDILFKKKSPVKVKVLFITETFRSWDEIQPELKEGFINELILGLPLKTAELFERMIGAMKLASDEVFLYPVEWDGQDLSEQAMSIASYLKPEVIITLGAKATQKILKSNDRLSMVHGQFFERNISSVESFQIVPLFHPSIIDTNQNMKKTAWADMQKIMKYLKKPI